jgi:hypothetical protein
MDRQPFYGTPKQMAQRARAAEARPDLEQRAAELLSLYTLILSHQALAVANAKVVNAFLAKLQPDQQDLVDPEDMGDQFDGALALCRFKAGRLNDEAYDAGIDGDVITLPEEKSA